MQVKKNLDDIVEENQQDIWLINIRDPNSSNPLLAPSDGPIVDYTHFLQQLSSVAQTFGWITKQTGMAVRNASGVASPHFIEEKGQVVILVEAARRYGVSPEYLNGVVITPIPEHTAAAYQPDYKKLLIDPHAPNSFFQNGGLDHEFAHAKLIEQFGDPIRTVTCVPPQFRDAATESYEEVAAHKLAYQGVPNRKGYVSLLREKYGINSPRAIRDFVEAKLIVDRLEIDGRWFNRIDRISEVLALFIEYDKEIHQNLRQVLQGQRLNGYQRDAITQLENIYRGMNMDNRSAYNQGLQNAARVLLRGWNV